MTKLIVFSICKDEAGTVGQVLDQIPKRIAGVDLIEKWVISDGSSDKTAKVAKAHGARVHEGFTQKRLAFRFQQAVEIALQNGADIAVNIDGDLQFNPADIPKLLKPILAGEADFVAADRFTDIATGRKIRPSGMPAGKYWANRLGAWIVGSLSGQKFRDVTCGFRAYNRKALLALNINSKYTYTQESFQVLAIKRLDIRSIPIKVKYYEGRKSRVVTSFLRFLFGSGINIMRAYRDFAPLRFFGWLGFLSFLLGLGATGFVIIRWLNTGSFSPYKFLGFAGLYFITLAIIVWVIALIADMMSRMLNNQEKILERLKDARNPRKD